MSSSSGSVNLTEKTETFHAQVSRLRQQFATHWWIVFLTVSLGILIQVIIIQSLQNFVFSEGKIIAGSTITTDGGLNVGNSQGDFFATQIELMGSPEVRRRAEEKLRITQPQLEPDEVEIGVEQQARSDIFILTAKSKNGPYAQALLAAIMEEYLQFRRDQTTNPADRMLEAYNRDLVNARERINRQLSLIADWKKSYNDVALVEQDNGAARYLATLKETLAKNQTEYQLLEMLTLDQSLERKRDQPQADPNLLKSSENSQIGGVAQDYLEAKKQVLVLLAQKEELSEVLKPKHPKIVFLNEEINRQNKLIDIYRRQSVEQVRNQKESLRLQISNTEKEIKEWEVKALEISGKLGEYKQLQATLDQANSEYQALSDKISKISSESKAAPDSMQIMAKASEPRPFKRGLAKALAIGILGGLVLGVGILLLINQLDDRVRSLSELQSTFDYPIIGHIPKSDISSSPLVQVDDDRHMLIESLRNVRSSIFFMPHTGPKPKVLLVTSSIPSEGKSTLSSNLAVTLAMSGAKTLLIDADMRRGALHTLFKVQAQPGLADYLTEQAPLESTIIPTSVENLDILPRGHGNSSANDKLLGQPTDVLLKTLYPEYEYILIDSAPVLAADDTSNLAPKVDGVIFVLRSSFTSARLVRRTLQILLGRQANILGLVFNYAESGAADYPYYRYEAYHKTAAV